MNNQTRQNLYNALKNAGYENEDPGSGMGVYGRKFKKLIMRQHPDKNPKDTPEQAARRLKTVQEFMQIVQSNYPQTAVGTDDIDARPRVKNFKPAPKQAAPKQAAPKQAAPKQAAPKQAAPKQAAPKQAAPKQAAMTTARCARNRTVPVRWSVGHPRRLSERCYKSSTMPLKDMALKDMCVRDIYSFIRAYGSRAQLIELRNAGSRALRPTLCKIYMRI